MNSLPPREPSRHNPAAMDTPITKRRLPAWALSGSVAVAVLLLGLGFWKLPTLLGTVAGTPHVNANEIAIAPVTRGTFDDFIPLRAVVAPLQTVFIDAVEGGRVEKKLVEDGALLTAGQPIAILTNSALQLEVIRSESEVTNQLNNLRTIEIQLARNRVENERAINEINWQLTRIEQKNQRDQRLAGIGFIAPAAAKDTLDETAYWRSRLAITRDGQRTDEALQQVQMEQLRDATKQLQANLQLARANLDALTVRAPINGRLTAFEVTLGQSLTRGQRIGQLDSPDAVKLVVSVDEHFLNRVVIGQSATADIDGKPAALEVKKINPQVRNGQFEIELVFADKKPMPTTLRRGQTVQARLNLGESRQALLLPAGAFLGESAGNVVFVIDGNDTKPASATRREVKLGRRNVNFVEIESGLKEDERVLVSSYARFADRERVAFDH